MVATPKYAISARIFQIYQEQDKKSNDQRVKTHWRYPNKYASRQITGPTKVLIQKRTGQRNTDPKEYPSKRVPVQNQTSPKSTNSREYLIKREFRSKTVLVQNTNIQKTTCSKDYVQKTYHQTKKGISFKRVPTQNPIGTKGCMSKRSTDLG